MGKRRNIWGWERGDGTLHIWAIPGAGRKRECVRGGARGSGEGDAGEGGVFGGAWVPGGAECAVVLPALAVAGCGGVRGAREVAAYGEVFGVGGEVVGGAAGCEAVREDCLRRVYSRQFTVRSAEGETAKREISPQRRRDRKRTEGPPKKKPHPGKAQGCGTQIKKKRGPTLCERRIG